MASFKKSLLNAWPWLLPLAVGAVAFLWPVRKEGGGHGPKAGLGEERQAAGRTRRDVAVALEEARQQVRAELDERERRRKDATRTRFLKLSLEERRAEILELKRKIDASALPGSEGGEKRMEYYKEAEELAAELAAAEGLPAVRWLDENAAEYGGGLAALPDQSPQAVLEYLDGCQRPFPCAMEDIGQMLAGRAREGGAEALLDAAKRTPWELFAQLVTGGFEGGPWPVFVGAHFELPPNLDPELWASSGAAEWLGAQGVRMPGVVEALAEKSPDLAVRVWAAGAATIPAADDAALRGLLVALGPGGPAADGLRAALAEAGPETAALLHAEVQRLASGDPAAGVPAAPDSAKSVLGLLFPGDQDETPKGEGP